MGSKLTVNLILIMGLIFGLWIVFEAEDFGEQLSAGLGYLPGLTMGWMSRVWTGLRRRKKCKPCIQCPPCICPDPDQILAEDFDFAADTAADYEMAAEEEPPAAPPFGPCASAIVASATTFIASKIWGANAGAQTPAI